MGDEYDSSIDVSDVDTSSDSSTDYSVDTPSDDYSDSIDDFSEDTSSDDYGEMADDIPDEITEDTYEDSTTDLAEDTLDVPEDIEENISSENFEETTEDISEDILEDTEEDVVEDNQESTDDSFDDIPEDTESDETEIEVYSDIPEEIEEDVEPEVTDELAEEEAEVVDEAEEVETTEELAEEDIEVVDETAEAEIADELAEGETEIVDETDEKSIDEKQIQDDLVDVDSLSQEEAERKISEYYGKHDYSPGDYETYSQDPEWRELMQKAYPEAELPKTTSNKNTILENFNDYELSLSDLNGESNDDEIFHYEYKNETHDVSDVEYEKYSKKDASDLEHEGERAIRDYSCEDYHKINNYLRGKAPDMDSYQKKVLDEKINLMSDVLDTKTLSDDMNLYRGLSNPQSLFGDDWRDKPLSQLRLENVGKVIYDDGFSSTSIERNIAKTFANTWNGTVMEIKAPKGSNGIFMGDISQHPYEKEVLLQRGSGFRIEGVDKDPNGEYVVRSTLIGRR